MIKIIKWSLFKQILNNERDVKFIEKNDKKKLLVTCLSDA
jgi:hypothetical protein